MMNEQTRTFHHAGAMPAPTWHLLDMNDVGIEVPRGLAASPAVTANVARAALGAADAFETALADEQAEWERIHPEPTPEEAAERKRFLAAEADATYGGTALSRYQLAADQMERSRSLAAAFEHGMGGEVASYLQGAAGGRIVVQGPVGQTVDAQVIVNGTEGMVSAAAIDVVASARSTVNLSIVAADSEGDADAALTGTTLRVFAGPESRVNVVRTQALSSGFTDIDDMGIIAAERSRVHVSQTVLGASKTYTGLAADLRGAGSRIDIATHYLGHGNQAHDFNYIVRHHGEKTECDLQANGVLAGTSSKTLRGTIDLIRGAKGSQGSEKETVLLVDEGVRNKTVPVILCNEDDVAGNHGATIGHIRDEQLFYLASRGLSPKAAEELFAGAMLEQAVISAPDDAACTSVMRLGERLAPGFAGMFDEEA